MVVKINKYEPICIYHQNMPLKIVFVPEDGIA